MTLSDAHQPLSQALVNSLQAHYSQLQGRRIWLACSGGRDSLSLAYLCQQLYWSGQLPFLPQLLHVHHGLQAANDLWAEQTQDWALKQAIPCQVLQVSVDGHSEQSARKARYEAMMQVMNHRDVLMLAHHGDDQAETLLLRLFNGAGVTGLGGMREWTSKQHPEPSRKQISLWRPWLTVRRYQITAYAKANALPFVDDPTNVISQKHRGANEGGEIADDDLVNHCLDSHLKYALNTGLNTALNTGSSRGLPTGSTDYSQSINDRAWLRSIIIPQLQARFPQSIDVIMRSSQLLQNASDMVNEQAHADIHSVEFAPQDVFSPQAQQWQFTAQASALFSECQSVLNIKRLLLLSKPRQSAAIHQWLSPKATDLPAPKRLVDEVLQLCWRSDNNHQTQHDWHSGQSSYQVRRYQDKLFRLDNDWSQWLDMAPHYQRIEFAPETQDLPEAISLKTSSGQFDWQVSGLSRLYNALLDQFVDVNRQPEAVNQVNQWPNYPLSQLPLVLTMEPLPRQLSVTLAGREGSKSGKKLLQALKIPAFMRESVVLCSMAYVTNDNDLSYDTAPLFLISLAGIHLLKGPFEAVIARWLHHASPMLHLQKQANK